MTEDTTQAETEAASFRVRAGRERWQAIGLFLASIPIALVIPFLFVRLCGRAQDVCRDLEAGGWFAMFGLFLLLAVVGWWLFWVGALVAWRAAFAWRVAAGATAVGAMCLVATWLTVPGGHPSDYAAGPASAECGPGGVPTWWPPVLPHH